MFDHFKRLIKSIFIYGLGDTVNKIIALLVVPLFTRYLSPAEYGVAGILIVANTLIVSLCDLGLTSGVARYFNEKNTNRVHLVSTAQVASVVLAILIAVVLIPFKDQLSFLLFKTPIYARLIQLSLLAIPFSIAVSAPMMRFRLEEKPKVFTYFSVQSALLGVFFNILFIVFFHHGLNGLFEGFLAAAVVQAVTMIGYSLSETKIIFSKKVFIQLFTFGSPFILSIIAVWILNWADRFILSRLTNLAETGLYTLGYSIGMAIMLPVGAFASAWMPFFTSIAKKPGATKVYASVMTYYWLILVFFILALGTFSRDYFYFFTTNAYHSAYTIVALIALAYAVQGSFAIAAVGSFLSKKTIYDVFSTLIASIINIVLMFVLIPYFGRIGAAWATFLAYLSMPLSIIFFTYRFYPIKYEFKRLGWVMLAGLGFYFLLNYIYQIIQPSIWSILARFIILLGYPLIFLMPGFLNTDERNRLFKIKILHAPQNIAGQASIISRAQRKLGFKSDVLVLNQNAFQYPADINLDLQKYNPVLKPFVWLKNFGRCFWRYNIFHFHFGESLLPYNLDLPLYRLFGKKTLMQYWGSDVIQTDLAQKYMNLPQAELQNILKVDDRKKRRKLARIARWVNLTVVGDKALLPYSKKSLVVNKVVALDQISFTGVTRKKEILIVHAPTNREIKGTKYILAAIATLKQKYPIKLVLVEKKSQSQTLAICQKADIIIDDVSQGPYGILAIECMALGKPVLCYIPAKFIKFYPGLPILNTNSKNLERNLEKLILSYDLRKKLGQKGREYVEKNHNPLMVAEQFIKIYQKLRR